MAQARFEVESCNGNYDSIMEVSDDTAYEAWQLLNMWRYNNKGFAMVQDELAHQMLIHTDLIRRVKLMEVT